VDPDPVETIAAAVLYEGYVLWPYRRSSRKNRQRWTFGGVYPRAHSELGTGDPWRVQTQCLVQGRQPTVDVRVRFLHVVQRDVCRRRPDGTLEPVDALQVGQERYLTWDEAAERAVAIEEVDLARLATPRRAAIAIPAGSETEAIHDEHGSVVGALVRGWRPLAGEVEVVAEPLQEGLFRLTVRVTNVVPWGGGDRAGALKQTLVATHAVLRVQHGELVSLTDPPEQLKAAAAGCDNAGLWPVLVGEPGVRDTMLAAPIILSDYPRIAPESPGDLFDGTEVDEMLVLNILTLTPEEKQEMRATDPRARAILERTEALTSEQILRLHGTIREFQVLRPDVADEVPGLSLFESLESLERPAPASVVVAGTEIRKGSRVRLRPRPGGDVFDLVLAGKVACVEGIDQDYEDRIHLAVVLEDDPGRDLGQERQIGHRFFFSPSEVEPFPDPDPDPTPTPTGGST